MSVDVERYLEKQKSPQKEVADKLRRIVLKTLPEVKEKLWMGVPWFEDRFYIVALKDHVNMGFSVKGLTEQERTLFEGKGRIMRHVKFYSLEDLDVKRMVNLFRLVAGRSAHC